MRVCVNGLTGAPGPRRWQGQFVEMFCIRVEVCLRHCATRPEASFVSYYPRGVRFPPPRGVRFPPPRTGYVPVTVSWTCLYVVASFMRAAPS
jgi:hypothetical protein